MVSCNTLNKIVPVGVIHCSDGDAIYRSSKELESWLQVYFYPIGMSYTGDGSLVTDHNPSQ